MDSTMNHMPRRFLTAQWRNLALLNFEVDSAVLQPFVPLGTELDLWQGRALVSLVGFEFHDIRVWGVPIPFHRNFEEVNLRFYVRRRVAGDCRRGVVFLRELAPRRVINWAARYLYGENYLTVPVRHDVEPPNGDPLARYRAHYFWRHAGQEARLELVASGTGAPAVAGSLEEFIIEHYWGYSGGPRRPTIEYRVDHPRWKLWPACEARFAGDTSRIYDPGLVAPLSAPPMSAFYADGSPVTVYRGQRIA
jgi:uncharacterized protein YqjF (DUF2071 family)